MIAFPLGRETAEGREERANIQEEKQETGEDRDKRQEVNKARRALALTVAHFHMGQPVILGYIPYILI